MRASSRTWAISRTRRWKPASPLCTTTSSRGACVCRRKHSTLRRISASRCGCVTMRQLVPPSLVREWIMRNDRISASSGNRARDADARVACRRSDDILRVTHSSKHDPREAEAMSEQENAPQNQKNKARRRLLKGIAAGGGTIAAGASLPERWTRPVVEAVSLPAHAQTTGESGPGLDDLSPWESGEQNFIAGGPEDTERFASLDSQSDTPDWDALSDNEILDFFTRPA